MSDIIKPGHGILYMKVGTHAKETLDQIIARKTKEIEKAGFAMWGYGGNTCHPQTMVQPFADSFTKNGSTIYLCMQEMNSKHFAEQVRADEFSTDGLKWETIPKAINVLGSRYALVIKDLHPENLILQLDQTQVAIGNSTGRSGDHYIQGRVDKACLEVLDHKSSNAPFATNIKIGLVAEIVKPYAVFLRNRR